MCTTPSYARVLIHMKYHLPFIINHGLFTHSQFSHTTSLCLYVNESGVFSALPNFWFTFAFLFAQHVYLPSYMHDLMFTFGWSHLHIPFLYNVSLPNLHITHTTGRVHCIYACCLHFSPSFSTQAPHFQPSHTSPTSFFLSIRALYNVLVFTF